MAIKGIKKKLGKDHNFYQAATVNWAQFGALDGYTNDGYGNDGYGPDMLIPFITYGVIFTNETSGQVIEYSFNGNTVHGILDGTSGSTTKIATFMNRVISTIWFRVKSGSTSANITVTAWGV